MIIYWLGCFFSIMILYCCNTMFVYRGSKLSVNAKAVISSLPLMLITGLRYNVGTDYQSYIVAFNRIKGGSSLRFEPIFSLLNLIIAKLGFSYIWVFLITSFLFFFLYKIIIETSKDPYTSIFLIVGTSILFLFMNAMRQLIGCAICAYSMKYLMNKKYLMHFLLIFIAAGFHYSCALTFIIFPLSKLKVDKKYYVLFLTLIFLSSNIIINYAYSFMSSLDYYRYYLNAKNTEMRIWLYINIVVFLLALVALDIDSSINRIVFSFQFVIAALALFNGKVVLLTRLMYVFCVPIVILIPQTLNSIKARNTYLIVKTVMIVLFFIYATYSVVVSNSHDVAHYQTIFSKM